MITINTIINKIKNPDDIPKIKEAYNYSKGDDFFTFCIFEDGSVTKTDAATDDEVGSSLEEMEQLESDGYEIEDVTDEYIFSI